MVWVGAEPEPVVFGQIIYILYISNLSCCNMSLFQTCILLKKQLSQKLLSDVTEKALCVCVCVYRHSADGRGPWVELQNILVIF